MRSRSAGPRNGARVADLGRLLAPDAAALAAAIALDLAIGDPRYALHPVRLMGRTLTSIESRLRAAGAGGYAGGIALFAAVAAMSLGTLFAVVFAAAQLPPAIGWVVHVLVLYSLLAFGDLLRHVWRIERALADGDLRLARLAAADLVGRDIDRMDAGACRRAAVESLSENLTDGFASPVFWYVLGGLPGIVLFKAVSTMDSMVGYKNERYARFGWCGARLDDLMNLVPARLTWLAITFAALVLPSCSAVKAWRVGLQQHGRLLGPNAGWSEAAAAGALERRIVGPIWLNDVLVTDLWIGDAADPPLALARDVSRALRVVTLSGLIFAGAAMLLLSAAA